MGVFTAPWRQKRVKIRGRPRRPKARVSALISVLLSWVRIREEVFMEGPLAPNMEPSLADVLLCTFESTNAGFSSFPLRKLLFWE